MYGGLIIHPNELTQQECVKETLQKLRDNPEFSGKRFSDIVDGKGHQYVDLVLEGGGVLGIALAGYTYCLEQVGFRFLNVAGTSAGAINAILIAASDTLDNEKSDTVVNEVANVPLSSFVDGNIFAKALVYIAQWKVHWSLKLIAGLIPALFELPILLTKLGLNPGLKFLAWLEQALLAVDVKSVADLNAKMKIPDGIKLHESRNEDGDGRDISARLALIAADITTRTKAEFPRMSKLYWNNPIEENPAQFARASMSVPFFFQPFKVKNIPNSEALREEWSETAGYDGDTPQRVSFVDGGVLSNFPIYVFHSYKYIPRAPTFGVRLGIEREKPAYIGGITSLAKAIFRSMQHILDYDFIANNQEYEKLISEIDTGRHYWLNFNLSDEAKKELFAKGVETASDFLTNFNWNEYKDIRRGMIST